MNPDQNEKAISAEQTAPETEKQETIFNDLTDMSGYDKNLKNARIYLYIIGALQLGIGIYEYATAEEYLKVWGLAIDGSIGAVFLGLALLSYKKPVLSFGLGLVLFILLQVVLIYLDSDNIRRGIFLKIFAIIALIKGLKDAREYEEIKRTLGAEGKVEFR